MLTMESVLVRLETLEKHVENLLKGTTMSSTIVNETGTAVIGALETATAVQQAVSTQSDILDKIEAGLAEFFSVAPTIVGAVDPTVSTPVNLIANAMSGLLGVLKSLHASTVQPAATAVTALANTGAKAV